MTRLKKKTIYLLRHGRTQYNEARILQGGTVDSPLTEQGICQAKGNAMVLKELLAPVPYEQIAYYSSPMGRARQTTALLLEGINRPLQAIYDARLGEAKMGSWEGKNMDELKKTVPEYTTHPDEWLFFSPDGESYQDVVARCEQWIKEGEEIPQDHIVVVCHGLLSRVLRGCLLQLPYEQVLGLPIPQEGFFVIKNGETRFVGEGK
ncbi:MAG: histidine phosphatase family protein [Clostridiales bacterium]|nr:histidine phosphatase family protein [Clostridiales bacterium]